MHMENLARRSTDIYISALLLVFPLWTGPGGYANITFWKFALYAVLTGLWALALLYAALRGRTPPGPGRLFAGLIIALLLWCALSRLASPYEVSIMGLRYDGLLPAALYCITALGCAAYGCMRLRYVNLLGLSVTLCCLVALLQLLGFNPLWLYPEGLGYYDAGLSYSGAFLGTIGNTNILGAFLALSCPLLSFTALRFRGRQLWLLFPAAFAAAVVVLSKSEAGLLGLLAATLAGLTYYVYRRSRRAGLVFALAEAAGAALFLAVIYLSGPDSGTLYELHELLHGRIDMSFGSSRVAIWREALRLFSERPLPGGGPGTFGLRSTLEFTRYVEETGLTFHTLADNAHSDILSCLADLGLPGAALYIAAAVYALRRSFGRPVCFALAAYYVQALFSTGSCFVLPVAAVLFALASRGGGETGAEK